MKGTIPILLFILISIKSFGTAQIPDIIIYKGDTLLLHNLPLNSFPNEKIIVPKVLFGGSGCFYTACLRNYVATWEIIGDELFLISIKNACYPTSMKGVSASFKGGVSRDSTGTEYADLSTLFPKKYKDGKVRADWVNGKLFAPQGKLLYYFHDGFQSIYEKELQFTLENGIIIKSKELDNTKTRKSKYTEDPKLLMEFISNNIKLENLPKSDSIKRRVIVAVISSDKNGKIDSVKVVRGVNEIYDKEALRIIKMIPDWDILYKHGQKIEIGWTIPIFFDLTDKNE